MNARRGVESEGAKEKLLFYHDAKMGQFGVEVFVYEVLAC